MDWKACVYTNHYLDIRTRFDWPAEGINGFDCSAALTYNDLWGGLNWIWTWPGDYLSSLSAIRLFFELGQDVLVGKVWSYPAPLLILWALLGALWALLGALVALLAPYFNYIDKQNAEAFQRWCEEKYGRTKAPWK